jgi:hypothetical protein
LTVLEWNGTDPDGDPLMYVLYLSDSEVQVTSRDQTKIVSSTLVQTRYELASGLTPGKTYYWTVVPDDTCTYGTCTNGVFSFRVNNRPGLGTVKDQFMEAGQELMFKLEGTDGDADDTLTYSIDKGPSGMTVRGSTGMLVWRPGPEQAGAHTVMVNLTDGYETAQVQFRVVVEAKEGLAPGVIIGIVIAVLVVVAAAVLIYIFVIRKGSDGLTDGPRVAEDDETRQLREQEEMRKQTLKEEGLEHLEGLEPSSSVHSSAQEAHAQDKTLEKKGYEELYGQPAPDKSEELTTEELKDELEKLAEQLKNAGTDDASIDLGEEESGP